MEQAIQQFSNTIPILKKSGVSRAHIFGSYARGDAKKTSDLDLLVTFKKNKKVTLLGLLGLQFQIEDLIGKRVDLITEESLCKHMRSNVNKEKKRLF